jgi:hypothetical protein
MLSNKFLYKYRLFSSIILFLLLAWVIHLVKPNIIYDKDGSFRDFGVGYRHKTVMPCWLVFAVVAILCYIFFSTRI